jgi:hypothetical protein
MPAARHPMPPEIAELSLEQIAERYIGRFRDKVPDWNAFEDTKIEGYRRAQHRFIGAGGSGKHDDPSVMCGRPLQCKGKDSRWADRIGCGHVSGLCARPRWPLALMKSANWLP